MDTTEKLVRRLFEAIGDGPLDAAAALVAEDFVDHGAPPWAPQGRAGYLQILAFLRYGLKLRHEVHDVVAAGDRVAVRATAHGVHDVDTLGFTPTHRPYAMPTMHLYRVAGGLLAEHWGVRDELGVLWQVGALRRPDPVALDLAR